MSMNCGKCGGRVFVDRMFQGKKAKKEESRDSKHIELFCNMCGKRWMLEKNRNAFTVWLTEKEKQLSGAYGISTSK